MMIGVMEVRGMGVEFEIAKERVMHEKKGRMDLWVVKDFLKPDDAERLYDEFEKRWQEDMSSSSSSSSSSPKSWLYTTNIPGQNQKIRSNENVEERQKKALIALKKGVFAYSKYELDRTTKEFKQASQIFNDPQLLEAVSSMLSSKIVDTHDMFISCYRHNDFLNIHQDSSLGTFAFVLSLTKNWTAADGGLLRLFCNGYDHYSPSSSPPCRTVVPGFNTLSIFRVRPDTLDHDVTKVLSSTKHRYAVTGWWYEENANFSEWEKVEQRRQKGMYDEEL